MPPRARLHVKSKTARSTIAASPEAAGPTTPPPKATSTTSACSLKTVDLKTLLALIGSPTSGTKPTLVSRFRHDVATPRLTPVLRRRAPGSAVQRIVSVDMGIRNLAYCVADVEIRAARQKQSKKKDKDKIPVGPEVSLSVVAWERIAVQELAGTDGDDGVGGEAAAQAEKESFLPAALSRIAYTLLTRKLLPHAPGTLLIEQQRYRSQGSSAVQEWTYRVNMLEGMLWAVLETLKSEEVKTSRTRFASSSVIDESATTSTTDSPSFVPLPSPHAVSPQRVAKFWMTSTPLGRALMAAKQPRRGSARLKVDKRDKISFLSAWLARSSGSDAVAIPSVADAVMDEEQSALGSFLDNDVDVSFETPAATATRDAFLDKMVGKARGRRKKKTVNDAAKQQETSMDNCDGDGTSLATTATAAAVTGDDERAQGQHQGASRPISQEPGEHQEVTAGDVEAQQRHLGSTRTDEAVQRQQQTDHKHESGEESGGQEGTRGTRAAGTNIRQGQNQGQGHGQGQGRQEHGRLERDPAHALAQPIAGGGGGQATTENATTTTSTAASITQEGDIGKLDDLADCLLQAAAWARWEANRRAVEGLMEEDGDEDALKQFAAACARGVGEV
ncbi:mitochondrial resolvase Ydc2 [Phyllosticta citrichinensis]|uniref:Mitochondrial resolvase Ydc2 n=1 Tax=Phyllosticta citrichinensis TaxID=1130410 RepID=A0ABR1Y3R1_9PEZI